MSRTKRITKAGIVYHVLNRANGRLRIFQKDLDFIAFENILAEGIEKFDMRLCGYCIMSNHWHMLLFPPTDQSMPDFMHWVTLTHTQRWHVAHGTTGIGHLYQGRYKSFPIQSDWRYLKAMQYIESNPLRAEIVSNAADWPWSSFPQRSGLPKPLTLSPGPVEIPQNWSQLVHEHIGQPEQAKMSNSIKRGAPYGDEEWTARVAKMLNLQSTLRKKGRPRKYPENNKTTQTAI